MTPGQVESLCAGSRPAMLPVGARSGAADLVQIICHRSSGLRLLTPQGVLRLTVRLVASPAVGFTAVGWETAVGFEAGLRLGSGCRFGCLLGWAAF